MVPMVLTILIFDDLVTFILAPLQVQTFHFPPLSEGYEKNKVISVLCAPWGLMSTAVSRAHWTL